MFYDLFKSLCQAKGISVTKATVDIGLSRTIGTKWRTTGATPNGDTLNKIADYFGVTVDYLLGNDDKTKSPAEAAEDDFKFALLNGTENLTEEGKKELLAYKDYLFHKYIQK